MHCRACGRSYELALGRRNAEVFCTACGGALDESRPERTREREDAFRGRKVGQVKLKKRLHLRPHYALYRGWNSDLRTDVRVKVFPETAPGNTAPYIHDLFERAAAARDVRDLNVAGLLDIGRLHDAYFLVLEYTPRSLSDLLAGGGKPLPPERALPIAEGVLRGLAALHRAGAVHGDIRPETVLLAQDGTARLDNPAVIGHRQLNRLFPRDDGGGCGPALYVAPERAVDERAADVRSDLYSLAAVLYEMLTGEPPLRGETAQEVMAGHLEGKLSAKIAARSDLPGPLQDFLARLTAPDPNDRPHDPRQALEELFRCVRLVEQAGGWSGALPGETVQEGRSPVSRWTLVAFALIVASIVPFFMLFGGGGEEAPRARSAHRALVVLKAAGPEVEDGLEERSAPVRRLVRYRTAFYPGLQVVASRMLTAEAADEDIEEARREADATHVLLVVPGRGLRRTNWTLVFIDSTGEGWSEQTTCSVDDGTRDWTELERTVRDLLAAAAERLELEPAAGWEQVTGARWEAWLAFGRAEQAEREDRLQQAQSMLEPAEAELAPAALLRGFCSAVLEMRRGRPPARRPELEETALPPRMRAMAGALEAMESGNPRRVEEAFGDWLARFPQSARGYLLLGLWRLHIEKQQAEALLTLRHAVKLDPGYLPAARACVELLAERSPGAVQGFLEEYPGPQETAEALAEYARAAGDQ